MTFCLQLVKNHSLSTEIYDDLKYRYAQLDEDYKMLNCENKILQDELILKEDQLEFQTEELKEADDNIMIYAAELRKAERQIKRLEQALGNRHEDTATLELKVKQLENANLAHVNEITKLKKQLSSLQEGGGC